MAVTYRTMAGWPKFRWNDGEFDATTKLTCEWSDVGNLLAEINTSPAYPYSSGPSSALACEASTEPHGQQLNEGTSLASYEGAVVTVRYSTRGPTLVTDHGYIIETFGAVGEHLPIDSSQLRWEDDSRVTRNAVAGPLLYTQEYRVTWKDLAGATPSYWTSLTTGALIGCANSNTVTAFTSSRSFAPCTLRFVPPDIRTTYSLGSTARTTVSLGLQYRPVSWNKFWNAATGSWMSVKLPSGTTYTPYPEATFPSKT